MTYAFDPDLVPHLEPMYGADLSDLAATREWVDRLLASTAGSAIGDSSVVISETLVPGPVGAPEVMVRIHTPSGGASRRSGILYIHGGAFVIASAAAVDHMCSHLAAQVDAVVVAVEYRLAPENPFPAGLEDCYAALEWMSTECEAIGVDPQRIAVGGESAGGGLAAAVALLARDRGGPALAAQVLITPELDDRLDTTSMRAFTDTPGWSQPNAVLSWAYYLNREPGADSSETSQYAAPSRATDLTGLPPTYITAYEFDPLRDESLEYGRRLTEAGVPTEMHLYPKVFHGCTAIVGVPVTDRIIDDLTGALIRALSPER
jgi:acetyl esterase